MKSIMYAFVAMLIIHLNLASAEDTIRIAAGNWPPYLSVNLKHRGVVAHIISDIFASEGYAVKFDFFPWARAYEYARTAKYDGTAVWLKTSERETEFYYSDPVVQEKHVFFHLKSYSFDWNSIDDLNGLTIGGLLKFYYGEAFETAAETGMFRLERISHDKQNFSKLLKKRIHIYPQEINVGYHVLQNHFPRNDIDKVAHHPRPLMVNFSHLLLSRKNERNKELIGKINKGLLRLKKSGRYEQYFEAVRRGEYLNDESLPGGR